MNFKEKYGSVALIAGASEGLGEAWSNALAKRGLDVILLARRKEPLEKLAAGIRQKYGVKATPISIDLNAPDLIEKIKAEIGDTEVNFMVYNAGQPYIGNFFDQAADKHINMCRVNMEAPLLLAHHFGKKMVDRRKGGMILMSSLAGFQGSGFLSTYASTKAFNRVLAESLWYEWKDKGVDVIGACAGTIATPNYINTHPKDIGMFAPKVQTPEEVAEECLNKIGKAPSFVVGFGNRIASFFMNRVLPKQMAVNIMGDTTRKMYADKIRG